jgi:hypothetical protein
MTDSQTVIYPPPRRGLPHLVVTISEGSVVARPAGSKLEAREMASKDAVRRRHSKNHDRDPDTNPAKQSAGPA